MSDAKKSSRLHTVKESHSLALNFPGLRRKRRRVSPDIDTIKSCKINSVSVVFLPGTLEVVLSGLPRKKSSRALRASRERADSASCRHNRNACLRFHSRWHVTGRSVTLRRSPSILTRRKTQKAGPSRILSAWHAARFRSAWHYR